MKQSDLPAAFRRLRRAAKAWPPPIVTAMAQEGASPYEILVAALLSARTLDTVTAAVAPCLFALARTPEEMVQLDKPEIERAVHGVGFGATKAKQILGLSHILLEKYDGRVPDELDRLDELPGVGRKIANLVLTEAFGRLGICVDTHVHRICNRWGYVQTKTPDETEHVLRRQLPKAYWIQINPLLVALGQNVCRPTNPICSVCPIYGFCERVGVTRQR
jgi:endonuclease III